LTVAAELPVEGALPDLGGATRWLNSEPLTPDGLRGSVVVVQFCTPMMGIIRHIGHDPHVD
jgi:hypothetical protein